MDGFFNISKSMLRRSTKVEKRDVKPDIEKPIELTNFVCTECLKNIPDTELAAAYVKRPLITCCKCICNLCCVFDCQNKVCSKSHKRLCLDHYYEMELVEYKCLSKNCHESITNKKYGFCDHHKCSYPNCRNEKMPHCTLCSYHDLLYILKHIK